MINQILLMAPQAGGSSPWGSMVMILGIFVVFYFFMIRPQAKKQKDAAKFKEEIKKGDKVVTIGGIHGRIVEVQDKTFTIEGESGHRIKIEKSAVSMESTKAVQKQD